jgi:hypothetical protein
MLKAKKRELHQRLKCAPSARMRIGVWLAAISSTRRLPRSRASSWSGNATSRMIAWGSEKEYALRRLGAK